MRFNGGPEGPSFGFEESGISEMERFDLMRELASSIEASAHEAGWKLINRDPVLNAMLSKVIEGGPDLDRNHASHLRKMIALRMWGLPGIQAQAAEDREFYELAMLTVHDEIEELETIPGIEDLPDMWDLALQDLLGLEGED